jgi:hypothetical protein
VNHDEDGWDVLVNDAISAVGIFMTGTDREQPNDRLSA